MNEIKSLVNDGMITSTDRAKTNASKKEYYRFLKENEFQKVGPGIYAAKDTWVDSLLLIHKRCPQAVISHDEALYFYGLIDHEPSAPTMTIYSGYNAGRLRASGYKVFYVKKEYLHVGAVMVKDLFGNEIPMYDMDRTICDMIRNRSSFEIQDFTAALKAYVRRKDKNVSKLYDYAKLFRIERIVQQYMEVLM